MNSKDAQQQRQQWREQYVARINRVQDYIEAHLDENLSLGSLAKVANFSRFHFHRIFQSMVGETLNQYINRIRVERGAALLIGNPNKTVTEVALDCGFSSSATFARSFRDQFEMSATDFRTTYDQGDKYELNRKLMDRQKRGKVQLETKITFVHASPEEQRWRVETGTIAPFEVEVKTLSEMHLIYVRHVGPYAGMADVFEGLYERLFKWAAPRGLVGLPDQKVLCIYHDDPNITEEQKLRVSAGITVPPGTQGSQEVNTLTIPAAKYGIGNVEVQVDQFGLAWEAVMAGWLPDSGYQCGDNPTFEMYTEKCEAPPFRLNICVPVRPL